MEKTSRIFVAGHRGQVGNSIVERLRESGYENIVTRSRSELDLTKAVEVDAFFADARIEYVFLSAAKVGGIGANNTYPADFIRDNLLIQTNVMDSAYRNGTRKLLFLGSSCIYPRHAEQPMREDALLTGPLEPTNEPYAIAKIAGIVMGQSYRRQHGFDVISLMPTNLYGPGDNFDPEHSHVLAALLRRFNEAVQSGAKEVVVWGTGAPLREFLHNRDLADACIYFMQTYSEPEILNVGTGHEVSIKALAELIADVVGYKGQIVFDASKPDGTPRKLMNNSRAEALGWQPKIGLRDGLAETYDWFLGQNKGALRL